MNQGSIIFLTFKRQRVYGKPKIEVQEKLREPQARAGAGDLKEGGKVMLAVFLRNWLETRKGTPASHTSLPYDRDVKSYLIPRLGAVKLSDDLTALPAQRLYVGLEAGDVSLAILQKATGSLQKALQHLVHPLGLIRPNPASNVPRPHHQPDEMHVLEVDQVKRFLKAAKADRLSALYQPAIDSAARQADLFVLNWSDIDCARSAIVVTKSLEEVKGQLLVKNTKTKMSRRRVAVSSVTMEALAEHRKAILTEKHYASGKPFFCDTEGGLLRKSNVLR